MKFSLDRRQLLASMALDATSGTPAQPATSLGAAPPHADLALKLMIVGRRRSGTTLAEHRHYIRRVHGELVMQNIAADPVNAPRRYVQNPVFDGTFRTADAGAADPFALNRDFVTQIWFPDPLSMERARQSAFYLEKVKHDEDNFVDQASVIFMPVRERVIGGAAAPANQRVKLFGFLQRSSGAAPDDFRRAWGAAPWAAGDSAGVLRYAQNDTLPTPMGSPLVDGIDEFWFDDEADARIFHLRWEAWVSEELVRPGLVPEARHFVLLAHEDVIHAGPR
ncbi:MULTISPECIES: EthD domain-containing protein [Burkholderia]|uniref:EthD domain-containing protein n=1 Tax=Burkholderia TaxID=32008 RepID=UPI000D0C3D59|nr:MULTISPECIES: EthD domain-containing protein [Burkholderia]MBR8158487.1 EthD domain-containing protein [Burkholderia cenocepacia]MDF3079830.1 EthD domain-containing protein [Burkholderia sola]MDF3100075.1 EthD domain-containing protein [Burkholderia semiarida]MDF3104542.1 EthD domain-containing protein [Burkholderia semiarida]MDN7485590.1 EthD domain-containing protein [Burkholderia orbicola]